MPHQVRDANFIRPDSSNGRTGLPIIPARWLAGALAASGMVICVLMIRNRLLIDTANWAFGALSAVICLLSVIRHRTKSPGTRWQARWHDFSESALLMIAITMLGAVGSYEAAMASSGFYDATLERADQSLHFDWLSLYRLVVQYPILQRLGALAYDSVFLTPVVLIVWHAWHGQRAEARQFLLTFWLASVITLLMFPLFPARGALEFLWHGPIYYMPTNGLYQSGIILALRDHTITHIDLGSLRGLVCAPSFHTVCAIIYMASVWPIAALRGYVVPLNLLMLLATPVEGTHYLVDMVLGALVAVVAIGLARAGIALLTWMEAPHDGGRSFLQ